MAEFVIDADGHIMEDHKDIFAHIKGNFSEMDWHSTWPMFDADGWQRGLARKGKREDPDAEAWVRFQNEHGIDCAVLYPTSALAIGMIQLPAWASAIAQGYNDWLYDRFTSQSPRLKGVALLAPQDPKAAAAELRRCVKELGFSAGLLPSVTNNRTPLYGSPVFHEIYDEAQRLDVPLTIHGGVSQNLGLDRVASFLGSAHARTSGRFISANHQHDVSRRFSGVSQAAHGLSRSRRRLGAVHDGPNGRRLRKIRRPPGAAAKKSAEPFLQERQHLRHHGSRRAHRALHRRLSSATTSSCGPPTSRTNANATNSAATCPTSTRAKIFPMSSKEKCSTTTRCDFTASAKATSQRRGRRRGTNVKN